MPPITRSRSPGEIFDAQPPPLTHFVSSIFRLVIICIGQRADDFLHPKGVVLPAVWTWFVYGDTADESFPVRLAVSDRIVAEQGILLAKVIFS